MSYHSPVRREGAVAVPASLEHSTVNPAHRATAWVAMAALNAALWTFGAIAVVYS